HAELAVRVDPRSVQGDAKLVTGEPYSADQGFGECVVTALEECAVHSELSIHVCVGLMDARRGECQQPANVLASDEMPRRPQQVCTKDLAIAEITLNVGVADAIQSQCK